MECLANEPVRMWRSPIPERLDADAIRELIRAGADSARLEATARERGFVPIVDRMRALVERGVTSAELVRCMVEGGRLP